MCVVGADATCIVCQWFVGQFGISNFFWSIVFTHLEKQFPPNIISIRMVALRRSRKDKQTEVTITYYSGNKTGIQHGKSTILMTTFQALDMNTESCSVNTPQHSFFPRSLWLHEQKEKKCTWLLYYFCERRFAPEIVNMRRNYLFLVDSNAEQKSAIQCHYAIAYHVKLVPYYRIYCR